MQKYLKWLANTQLFFGISEEELIRLLQCLSIKKKTYGPGEAIWLAGQKTGQIGMVLEGRCRVTREDYLGQRTIVAELVPGELFGEVFACAAEWVGELPVSVYAGSVSTILFLEYQDLVSNCSAACESHTRLIKNMLSVLASKNLMLNRRLEHLCKRTTREKVLSYLTEQAASAKSRIFTIPFNRQELADYLCVERSALSAVLSKLRKQGVIDFWKNQFTLKGGKQKPSPGSREGES